MDMMEKMETRVNAAVELKLATQAEVIEAKVAQRVQRMENEVAARRLKERHEMEQEQQKMK